MGKSTIYFARAGQDGPIKIGFTGKSPLERISELQTGCPWRIHLIGSLDGEMCHEDWLHDRFDANRLEGEWFHATPELLLVVADALRPDFTWPAWIVEKKKSLAKPEPKPQSPKERAVAAAGSAAELARRLISKSGSGKPVTRSAVQQWKRVPADRALEVERLTGVPRHELRPDLYPVPAKDLIVATPNHSFGG